LNLFLLGFFIREGRQNETVPFKKDRGELRGENDFQDFPPSEQKEKNGSGNNKTSPFQRVQTP